MSEITDLHDKHRRGTACQLVEADIAHVLSALRLADQFTSDAIRSATDLRGDIPGYLRDDLLQVIHWARMVAARLDGLRGETPAAPLRHLQAAE